MKGKVILLLMLFVCLGSLVGVYSFLYPKTETSQAQIIDEHSKELEEIKEVNGIEITYNGVRTEASDQPDSQYVIVDLTLKNNRETVYESSIFKITLVDEENYAHSVDSSIETKGILGGQLHPDRTNRGEAAFLVPKGHEYELVYTDHLRTGQVTWKVQVDKDE
ncbi:DUF4352 domain-containing protein [Alkalihalobacillus sp. MEB130]|uniref:DUF4352 domain-containing protein n=1 Tax=Alkalihalobacillus sp. MEB130 TaxID=2976704 RepID=UPI0028E06491|nr:DUF4352 domain-containing protein [Alkalihalobacillus sp. MEB130]MDT8860581.1 DUF4352 domain-containing protein [Alkalihalobacillus sp. MEB130]